MSDPLTLDYIETVPKRVIRSTLFQTAGLGFTGKGSSFNQRLKQFVRNVTTGVALPDDYYRRSTRYVPYDYLLKKSAIMHLRIDPVVNDALRLYLMQFETKVLVLQIDDHKHLTIPTGEELLMLHADDIAKAKEQP